MVNINGEITTEEKISIHNRGLAYGDAVFETIRVIKSNIVFWEDHYFRLMASMRIMRMEIPQKFSSEFLETEILALVKRKGWAESAVRIKVIVCRKEGGFYSPETLETNYMISASLLQTNRYNMDTSDYEIELFKDHFVNSGLLSSVKTNNRAINVLGSIFAQENDYQNCLLLNEKKAIVEALNANLFLVYGNQIKTPPIPDGCINGITRKKIIEIIKKNALFELIEESISPFELQKADEIFLSNVIIGIRPVTKFRKKNYNFEVSSAILSMLNEKVTS
ncbi:MAG TPA: aminotransferase class IV [Salinimicrobium sp.]|nr:aminotransferase class IV [Salinimicrobium sp.]